MQHAGVRAPQWIQQLASTTRKLSALSEPEKALDAGKATMGAAARDSRGFGSFRRIGAGGGSEAGISGSFGKIFVGVSAGSAPAPVCLAKPYCGSVDRSGSFRKIVHGGIDV